MSSNHSSTDYGKDIAPKFKQCVFDSTKNPNGIRDWIYMISSIIRCMFGGDAIENFLDHYLKRNRMQNPTRPEFLDDADLEIDAPGEDPGDDTEASTNVGSPGGNSTAASNATIIDPDPLEQNTAVYPKKYWHLNAESKTLDVRLFHTIVVIIEGPLRDVVTDLKGKYSRYSYAMIALWRHSEICANRRKVEAMESMANLMWHGDPNKWKLEFLKSAREIYEANVTIEHYIMQAAFNSFEGKNTAVQNMITDDINDDKVKPGMNLDALAARYMTHAATMQSARGSHLKVNNVRTTPNAKKGPCKFYAAGHCKKGDRCDWEHTDPDQGKADSEEETEAPEKKKKKKKKKKKPDSDDSESSEGSDSADEETPKRKDSKHTKSGTSYSKKEMVNFLKNRYRDQK